MNKYEDVVKKLTPLQYKVTQEKGTEPPFQNEYNDEYREGIYIDIVSEEALFSSLDKFNSGSGWPSFTKPIEEDIVEEKNDFSYGMLRKEVRSIHAKTHLGHVFDDGPNGMPRYCINSASLKFVPKEELKDSKYEKYLKLFK